MVAVEPARDRLDEPDPADRSSVYRLFYDEVAGRQLDGWLAPDPQRVLDISGGQPRFAARLVAAGHEVLHVTGSADASAVAAADAARPASAGAGRGRLRPVVGDVRALGWLTDGCVDAVLAESRVLSSCIAVETAVDDIARILRPGGRLLFCVDSLVLGLGRLAEQGRWAELADVPSADVVLVPGEDGAITRCFWPEELEGLLGQSGFDVDWVRPRSVLCQEAVERALAADPGALDSLVTTELALERERAGESIGIHLLASAVRR